MEMMSESCPTGILIDIGMQNKVLSNIIKENEKIQTSIENKKEKNIVADAKSSHPWNSNILDQSPPRPPPELQMNEFFTPKSNWKTPSPKSMKIISREASRIVDQLYSSPINYSEVMIHDEVFPAVKYLDDVCFDEIHIKSKSFSTGDMTCTHEKVDQSNPDPLDFTKCTISNDNSCISKDVAISGEMLPALISQSDIKSTIEHDSTSGNTIETMMPENALIQEFYVSDEDKIKSVICDSNSNPVIPKSVKVSNDKLVPESEATTHKKISAVAKVIGFKMSSEQYGEKNKENIILSKGAGQTKYEQRFSKTEESYSSIGDGPKEEKIRKNQILRNESMVEKSLKKNITAKCSVLAKRYKENRPLEDNLSKNSIGKPKVLLQKSQSLLYKKDPLYKNGQLLGTPVPSSVRRNHSFHVGSSMNSIPTVERKFMPTTDSCSRILKPKMSLNQVSNNGNGLSTPLQLGKFKLPNLSATNSMRRKSFAFNSNCSMVASDTKVAAQKDQHFIIKKPAVTSSTRLGLVKLNKASSHPKFKNDNLPRKLFP